MSTQTVIQGVVSRAEAPLEGAYVRLLDRSGEFTAEVPTSDAGRFRFFAAPGQWTVRTLAPGAAPVDRTVIASQGAISEVNVAVPAA